jgi:hypothetical protein
MSLHHKVSLQALSTAQLRNANASLHVSGQDMGGGCGTNTREIRTHNHTEWGRLKFGEQYSAHRGSEYFHQSPVFDSNPKPKNVSPKNRRY